MTSLASVPLCDAFQTAASPLLFPKTPEVFAYIEGYYNEKRLHSAIGYITPNQKERNFCPPQALAA